MTEITNKIYYVGVNDRNIVMNMMVLHIREKRIAAKNLD